MQGNPSILEMLDGLVSAELGSRDQWLLHARIVENWGLHKLTARMMEESGDEAGHAQKLIDRMIFLEKVPSMKVGPVVARQDLVEMLAHLLKLELEAITDYRATIRLCSSNDPTTRVLCERNLADEEDHVNWLEEQIYLLDKMGQGVYLQTQV